MVKELVKKKKTVSRFLEAEDVLTDVVAELAKRGIYFEVRPRVFKGKAGADILVFRENEPILEIAVSKFVRPGSLS